MAQPGSQSSEGDENVIVVPIDRSFSDGDPAIWPKEERFQMPDDTYYREKIATMWLKRMGAYEEGTSFLFFLFMLLQLVSRIGCMPHYFIVDSPG